MSFTLSKAVDPAKVFLTDWSRLDARWDPNYYRCMREFRRRVKDCAAPLAELKRSLALVQYGISERATEEPVGVPMLRMINLQDDSWDLSDLKYIQMSSEEKKPYLLKAGDILFNRTNSKELVGKCGVFNLDGEYVFASYLIRVRLKDGTLLPDYVTAFLSSGLGRIEIDAVSRQIAGMTNINAEEIRGLLIPALDATEQRKVVRAWQSAIQKRDQTLEKARGILSTIDDVLLDELGIRLKPEPPNTIESRIFQRPFSEVTGDRLDADYFRNLYPPLVESILRGRFPLSELKKACLLIANGKTPARDAYSETASSYPVIKVASYTGDEIDLKKVDHASEAQPCTAKRGDTFILSAAHQPEFVGRFVKFLAAEPVTPTSFVGELICVRADKEAADSDYLFAILSCNVFRTLLNREKRGQTSHIYPRDIGKLRIPLPSLPDQARIAKRVSAIRAKARALHEQAHSDLEKAKRDIETLILGAKPTK